MLIKMNILLLASLGAVIIAIVFYYYLKKRGALFKPRPKSPTVYGYELDYVNFDNAASTCPFQEVCDKTDHFLRYYSNIHRGHGFSSKISGYAFEKAREEILQFVGAGKADEDKKSALEYVCIFGKNTSECFNKLSHSFLDCPEKRKNTVILTTKMEHHSNMLPWRRGNVDYIDTLPDGSLDMSSLQQLINKYSSSGKKISLISVTGASNVTGIVNNLKVISQIAHSIGAFFCVDGAQLVPHKKVNMREMGIDFMCFSAHKMYAPFGIGVLIGRKDYFDGVVGAPCMQGGGEVKLVTLDSVIWKESPEKDEEGTQNIPGVIALGEAIKKLQSLGMENVEKHEQDLYEKAYAGMSNISPDIKIISPRPGTLPCVNILTFYIVGIHPGLVGTILGDEYGIGCRTGCFCAHPYVSKLMGVDDSYVRRIAEEVQHDDYRSLTGFVRISFSLQNDADEIARLVNAIKRIVKDKKRYIELYNQLRGGEFVRTDGKTINGLFDQYL
jgi:cysteine desulfurase / selenocysteine lyase